LASERVSNTVCEKYINNNNNNESNDDDDSFLCAIVDDDKNVGVHIPLSSCTFVLKCVVEVEFF